MNWKTFVTKSKFANCLDKNNKTYVNKKTFASNKSGCAAGGYQCSPLSFVAFRLFPFPGQLQKLHYCKADVSVSVAIVLP